MAIIKLDKDQKEREAALIKQIESGNRQPGMLAVKIFSYVHDLNKATPDAKAHYSRLLKDNFPMDWINHTWRDQMKVEKPQRIRTKEETSAPYKEHGSSEPEAPADDKPVKKTGKKSGKTSTKIN